jgi:predicted ArsR family transcriptional regulator
MSNYANYFLRKSGILKRLMKSTRQRLVDYLQIHRLASAEELSRALQVTPAAIRHHLHALIDEGAIRRVESSPPDTINQRGRRAARFSLSTQAQAHNLDRLAAALLAELLVDNQPDQQQRLLVRIADRLWQKWIEKQPATTSREHERHKPGLTERLITAIRFLNSLNYQARWEAHAAAPRIFFGSCPYATILPEYPELCQMDESLLEQSLGTAIKQTGRLEPTPSGTWQCVFQVIQRKT